MFRLCIIACLTLSLFMASVAEARAQYSQSDFDPQILKINEDDYLGKTAPDIKMLDEAGKPLSLSTFSGKPLVLLMLYYDCPNICPLLGEELAGTLSKIGDIKTASDYNVLVLSFDKDDTPEEARAFHQKVREKAETAEVDSWFFATANEADIKTLAEAVGYRFFYSAEDGMFVHPNVSIFLSPDSKITRYLFGIKPDAFNARMALLESAEGKIGKVSLSSLITLACYKYDHESKDYVLNIPILFASVGPVFLGMTGILSLIVYRKKKKLQYIVEGSER